MRNTYPKVLIIGETFHLNSGGGITLSNLFKGWPIEMLANAVDFRDLRMNKDFANIKVYELFESKMIFKVLSTKHFQSYRSTSISSENNNKISFKSFLKYFLKKTINKLLGYTGLEYLIFHYKIENNFLDWINAFNPDFIYTQLSSRESIKLITELHDITNIPIAIHIMDDWPSTICSKGLFKNYLKRKINKEFIGLLEKSSIFLSISEYMSEEYLIRYGKSFIPFHNPLDLNIWDNPINKLHKTNKMFNFLHAGRIGNGITNSLLKIARILQELNDSNIPAYLYIQSSNIDIQFKNKILKYSCVKINPPAAYKDIPAIIKDADILVLCNDFDKKGKNFLKYSIPTKASEYMISKVPILVFSDYTSAIYKHAKENKWAFLVGEDNDLLLKAAIIELIKNTALRKVLAERAFQYAKLNFDCNVIREKFRNEFANHV